MPEVGDIITKKGKEYEWSKAGYWSTTRTLKPVNETFCPACAKLRGEKKNPTLVLNNTEGVYYRFYGMCSECYNYVNSHREEYFEEFDRIQSIKKKYNQQEEINNG